LSQAWLEIERATTKLHEEKSTRRAVFIIGFLYSIPYVIFFIAMSFPGIDRYGPLLYLYIAWPVIFNLTIGIFCITVYAKFMIKLRESAKIQDSTRAKITRVNLQTNSV
jgi:hypothetical protein